MPSQAKYPNGIPGWLDDGTLPNHRAAIGRRNGQTLREQFAAAVATGANIIMVKSFNQWTGCLADGGTGENYTPELSTDMEPMSGGFGALYLQILQGLIASFKSGTPSPLPMLPSQLQSPNLRSGVTVSLLSRLPGRKAVDVRAASTQQGALLQLWTATMGSNQRWLLQGVQVGDGTYTVQED